MCVRVCRGATEGEGEVQSRQHGTRRNVRRAHWILTGFTRGPHRQIVLLLVAQFLLQGVSILYADVVPQRSLSVCRFVGYTLTG